MEEHKLWMSGDGQVSKDVSEDSPPPQFSMEVWPVLQHCKRAREEEGAGPEAKLPRWSLVSDGQDSLQTPDLTDGLGQDAVPAPICSPSLPGQLLPADFSNTYCPPDCSPCTQTDVEKEKHAETLPVQPSLEVTSPLSQASSTVHSGATVKMFQLMNLGSTQCVVAVPSPSVSNSTPLQTEMLIQTEAKAGMPAQAQGEERASQEEGREAVCPLSSTASLLQPVPMGTTGSLLLNYHAQTSLPMVVLPKWNLKPPRQKCTRKIQSPLATLNQDITSQHNLPQERGGQESESCLSLQPEDSSQCSWQPWIASTPQPTEPESQDENFRASHNVKEQKRRARIKKACEAMRDLVPGLCSRTDTATVFEFAARYIHHLRKHIGPQFDKEFLLKYNPY